MKKLGKENIEYDEFRLMSTNDLYLNSPLPMDKVKVVDMVGLKDELEHSTSNTRKYIQTILAGAKVKNMLLLENGRGAWAVDFLLNGGEEVTVLPKRKEAYLITRKNILRNNLGTRCTIPVCDIDYFCAKNNIKFDAIVLSTARVEPRDVMLLIKTSLKEGGLIMQMLREDVVNQEYIQTLKEITRNCYMKHMVSWIAEEDGMLRLLYYAVK